MMRSDKIKLTSIWISLAVIVVLLDQFSKYLAVSYLTLHQAKPLLPVFNLNLAHNTGAAFSFLSQGNGWQNILFGAIAVVISVVIVVWLYRLPRNNISERLGLSLILGGAIGNLIDRVAYGYVIDFIQLYLKEWVWPTFNIADAAISVGAVILLLTLFIKPTSKYH